MCLWIRICGFIIRWYYLLNIQTIVDSMLQVAKLFLFFRDYRRNLWGKCCLTFSLFDNAKIHLYNFSHFFSSTYLSNLKDLTLKDLSTKISCSVAGTKLFKAITILCKCRYFPSEFCQQFSQTFFLEAIIFQVKGFYFFCLK